LKIGAALEEWIRLFFSAGFVMGFVLPARRDSCLPFTLLFCRGWSRAGRFKTATSAFTSRFPNFLKRFVVFFCFSVCS